MGHGDQRDEHRGRKKRHVPKRKFHNRLEARLINKKSLHNDAAGKTLLENGTMKFGLWIIENPVRRGTLSRVNVLNGRSGSAGPSAPPWRNDRQEKKEDRQAGYGSGDRPGKKN